MIKQTAGMAFQAKEEFTRQAQLPDNGEAVDAEILSEPIFQIRPPGDPSMFRFCLNCITFEKLGSNDHTQCNAASRSVQSAVKNEPEPELDNEFDAPMDMDG